MYGDVGMLLIHWHVENTTRPAGRPLFRDLRNTTRIARVYGAWGASAAPVGVDVGAAGCATRLTATGPGGPAATGRVRCRARRLAPGAQADRSGHGGLGLCA